MSKDVAISYNAKILEVEDNVKQLKSIKIDTTGFSDTINQLKEETDQKIKGAYDSYYKSDSNIFLQESLMNIYHNAIKQLDKINNHIISEYETYYKIKSKNEELKEKINNIEKYNINEIIEETRKLLQELKTTTTTIDYKKEQNIIDSIYQTVYKVIKLELIYTNNQTLLDYVKQDEDDISYLSKLVKEELEIASTQLEEGKIQDLEIKEELKNKILEIDKAGFNDIYFLDKKLINLLTVINHSELTKVAKSKLFEQIKSYNETSLELTRIKSDNVLTSDRISELKLDNKNIFAKRLGKKILLVLNMGLLSCAIIGSIKLSKEITKAKVYKTVTTTYDTSMNEQEPIIEYLPSMSNSRSLIEYSQWEEPGYYRDNYTRNVYTYNLNKIERYYEDVKDYLTTDLKDSIILTNQMVETNDEIPEEKYSGNKYVITQTIQDKSDYHVEERKELWIFTSIFSSAIITCLDALLLHGISKVTLKELRQQRKNNKQELKEQKQLLLDNNICVNELTEQLSALKNNIETEYEELPSVLKQDKKIKQKMLILEDENK